MHSLSTGFMLATYDDVMAPLRGGGTATIPRNSAISAAHGMTNANEYTPPKSLMTIVEPNLLETKERTK